MREARAAERTGSSRCKVAAAVAAAAVPLVVASVGRSYRRAARGRRRVWSRCCRGERHRDSRRKC